jgi:uncharacterized membrane protein
MDDKKLQRQISLLLRIGISASGLLMAVGFIMLFISGDSTSDQSLKSGWSIFRTVMDGQGGQVFRNPTLYLFSGIIVLMLTPIFRVIFSLIGFAAEKDWRYAIISGIVLVVIAASISFSIVH